jgi:hypothetical protein
MINLLELFKTDLEKIFYKHFPESGIYFNKSALGKGLCVGITLGKNREEFDNGIEHNDIIRTVGIIYYNNDSKTFEFDFKPFISGVKSDNPYHYCKNVKIRTTTIKGDQQKVIKRFDNIISKLKTKLVELHRNNELLPIKCLDIETKLGL